jgi:hypothetical protein
MLERTVVPKLVRVLGGRGRLLHVVVGPPAEADVGATW